jgi:SpoVK/Ycf46/Vps4 family AAA+-type ATPase
MPLSVEVADALLDICELTGHFDQLKESLVNYYEWLMAQRINKRIRKKGNVVNVIGWRSENAFGPPEVEKIHTWTTSRVALFLLNYSKLLDDSLQNNLLQNSGLSFKKASDLIPWKDIQPMDLGRKKQTLQVIEEQFITPHASTRDSEHRLNPEGSFSMFLYGPPGTSKTSVAEGLAGRLDLKLVTINVSDFIMLGVEAVEQRAKIIFDVLGELKNIVVLFDEIDRLITDRDSDRYLEQGDILQLMTPSMLTKLNDLRRKRKLLFVVSTNYFERIDRAIRRPGRIDQHFLISPFDQKSRVALLQNFICKFKGLGEKGKDWEFPSNAEMRLNSIAKLAPLLVFEELKGVFDRSTSGLGKGDIKGLLQNLESEIHKVNPSINLESYKRKFAEMRLDPEPPFMEFFFLCFLLAEVDQADSEIRRLFQEQWEEWKEKNAPEAREFTSDEWVKEQLKRLTKSQNKRGKESTKRAGKEE